ncbi:Ribose ABC transport system, permease protein RbsC [Rhodopirellula islandica]|uniref:Ribose ABC transport system, permease protein RbsC n=1 Tax=Rhodopirellula islandica TaxID=595434 RepID=A0A0J1BBG6_RHOIS|nr:ABC transporter permease [Rhodopirellula islandica]KLU03980.1 Ribose ABC transport system, permease protein RbsC [Rhodopirellula islandica]
MSRLQDSFRKMAPHLGLVAVLLVLVAIFSLLSKNFFQWSTLVSIANQVPDLTFLVVGMTLVLIIGGIDLSVGSLLAVSSAVLGVLMANHDWSIWAALPVAVLVASIGGGVNGAISIGFGIPSFIVTLGMLEIARGATKVVTDSQSIYIGSRIEWFGQPLPGAFVSPAFMAAIGTVILGQLFLTRTVWGRYCIAIGTNAEAVRMSGIRSAPLCIGIFAISGMMCGLAGLAQTSRLSTADPNAAIGIELAAIAACVIGGTSLMGGRGNVVRSFIGVLIIQVLQTGLAQVGVSDASKQIITGVVIVVAVLLDALRTRWDKSGSVGS